MFKILNKSHEGSDNFRFDIQAPLIAKKTRPGQFIILRLDEHGERIPLTLCDWNITSGSITVFIQVVGKSSRQMASMEKGQSILDIVGPLGNPTEIEKFGRVVLVGGGTGIAAVHPIARSLTKAGNHTISILGARTQNHLVLLEEMKRVSSEVRLVTNDGSLGTKGFVTDELSLILDDQKTVHRVIAVGPLVMMKAVADLTRSRHIKTLASMNPIMVDGTGMCGACRVMVGGEMKFACVDGPEFDAHEVDFDGVINRMKTYTVEEREASEQFQEEHDDPCRVSENPKN